MLCLTSITSLTAERTCATDICMRETGEENKRGIVSGEGVGDWNAPTRSLLHSCRLMILKQGRVPGSAASAIESLQCRGDGDGDGEGAGDRLEKFRDVVVCRQLHRIGQWNPRPWPKGNEEVERWSVCVA